MLFIGSPPSHFTPTNCDTKLLKNQSTLELTQACLLFSLQSVFILFFSPQNPNQLLQRRKYMQFFWTSLPYSHCNDNSYPLFPYPPSVGLWLYGLLQLLQLATACHSDPKSEFQPSWEPKALLHSLNRLVFMLDTHFQVPWAHCLQQVLVTTKIKGLSSSQNLLCLFSKLKGSSSPEGLLLYPSFSLQGLLKDELY